MSCYCKKCGYSYDFLGLSPAAIAIVVEKCGDIEKLIIDGFGEKKGMLYGKWKKRC